MSVSKSYAIVFGSVYTFVGVVGFFVTTSVTTADLVIFPVNLLHNIAHIALIGIPGLVAYWAGRSVQYARAMTVLFAVLVVGGLFPQPFLGIIPLGGWDIALHALSGIAAFVAGWVGYRSAATRTA